MHQSHVPNNWWKKEFGEGYYNTFGQTFTFDRTKHETDFIIKAVKPGQLDNILDLGCGHGRHAIELAKRNYRVTGLDYSNYFLKIARLEAKNNNVDIKFIRADMRNLNSQKKYNVILSMFSAFGYFPHEENLKVLRRVYTALVPGGKFLLDVMNSHKLFSDIYANGEKIGKGIYRRKTANKIGNITVKDVDMYYPKTQLVHLRRSWDNNRQKGVFDYYMIHYTLEQYRQILEKTGFNIINLWGDYNESRWGINSWRTIMLCQKPNNNLNIFDSLTRFINLSAKKRWPDQIS